MNIAISNIAWDVSEDAQVAYLLQRHGIDAIDIAPGKYFPNPKETKWHEIARVSEWWGERGVQIFGMQALMFGTSGLNLFGSADVQRDMLNHLDAVCRIGSGLGARRLVFGSPKNRDRSTVSEEQALDVALDFFRRLGDIASSHGVIVCLEPNPPCYGANFMTNSPETARIVSQVDHPGILMQLDTGAITVNGEDPDYVVGEYGQLIGHIHASEPDLVTLGDGQTDHAKIACALNRVCPDRIVSIEMLPSKNEPHAVAIDRAVGVAIRHYRAGAANYEHTV
jgi:sugar phosphate isomerase/epimerase